MSTIDINTTAKDLLAVKAMIKAEHGDLYAAFSKQTTTTRFLVSATA